MPKKPAESPIAKPEKNSTVAEEVAREAGVSVVTVSRAFHNSPLVSAETRKRVLAVARQIGYKPLRVPAHRDTTAVCRNNVSYTAHEASAAEVARMAGVATVTVSRAFNNSPLVTPETRERVLLAAREIGHSPSSAASTLSKGRTNTVALVFRTKHLFYSFQSQLLAGANSVIAKHDFTNLLTVVPEQGNIGGWLRQLVRGSAPRALILHYEIVRDVGAELILSLGIPVVVAGLFPDPSPAEASLPAAGFNHAGAIQQCIRHLVALGHSRIMYLDNPGKWQGPSTRNSAFKKEMEEQGLPLRDQWLINCNATCSATAASEEIQRIYSQKAPFPTAVICASDLIASGVVNGAGAWGRRVPEDLSVIGYQDSDWAPFFTPPLTTIHQRGWDLGIVLAEKLMDNFRSVPLHEARTVLPMRLIVRNSTRALNHE